MADEYNPATGALIKKAKQGDTVPVTPSDNTGTYLGSRGEQVVEYAGDGSYQPVAVDLNLDAAAGTSETGDSAYLGPIMGNVLGAALTKTKNIIAGLIGKFSITGDRASTYPLGGVIGEIGDGVSEADGAVIAVLGGDSEQTNARAAFTVDNQNSTPGSAFEYGLDLRGVDHDGFGLTEYTEGAIRFPDGTVQDTAGAAGASLITIEEKSASFEVELADLGKDFYCTSALTVTFDAALPVGFHLSLSCEDGGIVVDAGSGDTLRASGGSQQVLGNSGPSMVSLTKLSSSDWRFQADGGVWGEP